MRPLSRHKGTRPANLARTIRETGKNLPTTLGFDEFNAIVFNAIVKEWIATAKHPVYQRHYTECVYQPMLDLLLYLRLNEFKTFIVSGGGIEFMRPWVEEVYGIPPEQVIGCSIQVKYEQRDGKPVPVRLPEKESIAEESGTRGRSLGPAPMRLPLRKIPEKVHFAVSEKSFAKLLLLGTTIALLVCHGRVASLLGNASVLPKRRKHCEGPMVTPSGLRTFDRILCTTTSRFLRRVADRRSTPTACSWCPPHHQAGVFSPSKERMALAGF